MEKKLYLIEYNVYGTNEGDYFIDTFTDEVEAAKTAEEAAKEYYFYYCLNNKLPIPSAISEYPSDYDLNPDSFNEDDVDRVWNEMVEDAMAWRIKEIKAKW